MSTLLFGWAFLAAFHVVFMRGYSTSDPVRTAGHTYRRDAADQYGLLPPSRQPLGLLLWLLTAAGFVAGIVFALIGDRYIGVSSGVMLLSFLATLWRDNQWLKAQPDYLEALAAATDSSDAD